MTPIRGVIKLLLAVTPRNKGQDDDKEMLQLHIRRGTECNDEGFICVCYGCNTVIWLFSLKD